MSPLALAPGGQDLLLLLCTIGSSLPTIHSSDLSGPLRAIVPGDPSVLEEGLGKIPPHPRVQAVAILGLERMAIDACVIGRFRSLRLMLIPLPLALVCDIHFRPRFSLGDGAMLRSRTLSAT